MCIEKNDKRIIRCRMLGHEVPFEYCRQGSGELPCRNIFNCWFELFPVEEFLRQHYSDEQIEEMLRPGQPKMASLIELIQQAQKNKEKKS